MKNYVLGIDTSNYTTSIAVIDDQANLILDHRKILTVKEGERGLRQSDALFQHIMNMPVLFSKLSDLNIGHRIKTVSVSSRPRPVEGSYMPVFRASQSFGKIIANTLNCEYKEFSHQEGHIEAAKWSSKQMLDSEFLAVHVSGGTTEILHVKNNDKFGYNINILGGTLDISAGQFIDRIGVKLGFSFPAGKRMDELIMGSKNTEISLPVSVKDTYMSFSGPETAANKLIQEKYDKDIIAMAVFKCIARSLKKTIKNSCKNTRLKQILLTGGVASSEYIRSYLLKQFSRENYKIYFGNRKYCTDNAVGTALLAIKR
ncbi:O-sialoglycoprotein endopeptidase [Crassaminicella thermophila]|uniref:N(6)-L-threonylcarbamoyladenine synthase n=1 Tax=Crassaminicella thermophila TaxID=2599308 RepID=A0A5C0SDW7_CRATE|nr:O-sialoglycoprotein endopeptidase [Crassaminicella thermophila]QEK12152.1 O-sialoglycoprotein endopeptidase [Crassaminicella thermophila]